MTPASTPVTSRVTSVALATSVTMAPCPPPPPCSSREEQSSGEEEEEDDGGDDDDDANSVVVVLHDNNDNNNLTERHKSSNFTISSLRCELSQTRTLKRPGRSRVQITLNTPSAYHVEHVVCHVVRKKSSAIKFSRVVIAFILAYFIG